MAGMDYLTQWVPKKGGGNEAVKYIRLDLVQDHEEARRIVKSMCRSTTTSTYQRLNDVKSGIQKLVQIFKIKREEILDATDEISFWEEE